MAGDTKEVKEGRARERLMIREWLGMGLLGEGGILRILRILGILRITKERPGSPPGDMVRERTGTRHDGPASQQTSNNQTADSSKAAKAGKQHGDGGHHRQEKRLNSIQQQVTDPVTRIDSLVCGM